MNGKFDFLNLQFFTKAEIYPASIGTFRYRFQHSGWIDKGAIQVWVYENVAFELAQNVETETFPWTQEGIEQIKTWLELKLKERGSEPYRIPFGKPAEEKTV